MLVPPIGALISGGPIAREVSIVGERAISRRPLSRCGTAEPCFHPSIHPHVRPGNEWSLACRKVLENRVAMGWPLGQRFIPPTDICIYVCMCISTSRPGSRRFVLAEETIEERRPVAEGSNGSTWFPARNWVTG